MTFAVIASFGLALAGIMSLAEKGINSGKTKETVTTATPVQTVRSHGNVVFHTSAPSAESRRAPSVARNHVSGEQRGKVNRTLTRNNYGTQGNKEIIIKSLRDNHMASVEERAKEAIAAQNAKGAGSQTAIAAATQTPQTDGKKETALAAKKEATISQLHGAKKASAENTGDYRKKLLREAVLEVINSEEPWKELIAIALVQIEIKDTRSAYETLQLAKKFLPAQDTQKSTRDSAIVSLIQAMGRLGQLEQALDISVSIKGKKQQNQAISTIITEYVNRHEFSAAKTLVSSLTLTDYKEACLRNIAEGEARFGQNKPAISTISLISNMAMRNDALKRVAVTQARAKEWDLALSTASLISETEIGQQAHADIISIRIDSGDLDTSYASIPTIQKERLRDSLYGKLAKKYGSLGNIRSAQQVAGLISNEIGKEDALANIAVSQAKLGDTFTAFNNASNLVNKAPHTQGVRDVTLVEANMRGIGSAINMAAMIRNQDTRDATLRAIAQREAGIGNFREAVNCAHSINAPDCRVLSLAETALSSIKIEPNRQAVSILETTSQMLSTLEENNNNRTEAIIKLAHGYALANRMDEAVNNLFSITSSGRRDSALEQIAYDCVDKKKLNSSLDLAYRIKDDRRRKNALENIALRYARHVSPNDAKAEIKRFNTKEQRAQFLRGVATKK